jgi:hypothetical protein
VEVKDTVPENPLRLVNVTATVPDDPWATVSEDELRAILKSGEVDALTTNFPTMYAGE